MTVLHRLSRWAWLGAGVLAAGAGMVNAVGYMGFRQQSITNLTGSTSLFGIALAEGDGGEVLHWGVSLLAFMFGAMLSGFLVKQSTLQLGRHYGVALLLESTLLFAAVPFLHEANSAGLWLAAMAAGLQNGMASTYSGAVFRTTHVSGMFTDLGIYLGQRLRGLEVDTLRIRVCLLVIGTFALGGALGAWAFALLGERAILLPAVLTGLAGAGYTAYCLHIVRAVAGPRSGGQH